MVNRYDFHHCVDDGDYVLYNDYAALEARLTELEKDAARYRWLRDSHNYPAGPYWNDLGNTCEPEEMDEMIDEAMRREA